MLMFKSVEYQIMSTEVLCGFTRTSTYKSPLGPYFLRLAFTGKSDASSGNDPAGTVTFFHGFPLQTAAMALRTGCGNGFSFTTTGRTGRNLNHRSKHGLTIVFISPVPIQEEHRWDWSGFGTGSMTSVHFSSLENKISLSAPKQASSNCNVTLFADQLLDAGNP
jgi:hypothetical protein